MTLLHPVLRRILPLVLVLSACGSPSELWPSPEAPPAAGVPQTAQQSEAGVRLTVSAGKRPAGGALPDGVTPLWLSIENDGVRAVALDRGTLRLVRADGTVYRPLPPRQADCPTPLPSGPVAPDGRAVGWVCFDTPSAETGRLEVRGEIADAYTGGPVLAIRLAFDVPG